jgi:hypothetical protein
MAAVCPAAAWAACTKFHQQLNVKKGVPVIPSGALFIWVRECGKRIATLPSLLGYSMWDLDFGGRGGISSALGHFARLGYAVDLWTQF